MGCVVGCGMGCVMECSVMWCIIKCRDLTPAESDVEFLMIAKDLPRYGKHLFVAKVSRGQCPSPVHMSSSAHTH